MTPEQLAQVRAEFEAALAEVEALTTSLREENVGLLEDLAAEREQLARQRRAAEAEVARGALAGEQGGARRELQRRIDRGESSWSQVMAGIDRHWSAEEVRQEVIGDLRATVDELEREDPDLALTYRRDATLRRGEQPGEWP
jgi:hypothetical protein